MELTTIQKREKLNKVFTAGEKTNNAYHSYEVISIDDKEPVGIIQFQKWS